MKSLIETLADARRRQVGVGHFNFSEPHRVQGDRESAVELKPPVMVSVSESEHDFIGVAESAALVKTAHRVAARSRGGFQNHPGKVAPYKILPAGVAAIKETVTARLKLFTSCKASCAGSTTYAATGPDAGRRRALSASMISVQPSKTMSMPINIPITHSPETGHESQIMKPSKMEIAPLRMSHPR